MKWHANLAIGMLTILFVFRVAAGEDSEPAEYLARLNKEVEALQRDLNSGRANRTEAEQDAAVVRYCQGAAGVARRALALAEAHPGNAQSAEALVWIFTGGLGGYSAKLDAECNAAYVLLSKRYFNEDAILPLVRIAWANAGKTAHAESFLRSVVERSTNPKVKALACFSLARHQQLLLRLHRYLDDPFKSDNVKAFLGPENLRRIRAVNPDLAKREAEALYVQTLKEFADLRPLGDDLPPLGEQAKGGLFKLRHLDIGSIVPEIAGEDLDGQPIKLSDFRGKVVVISFWATWCGPCMGMVPQEIALVERMKGRPFVLIGVNGDDDRDKAKKVSAQVGITWRSFWNGACDDPISVRWGVSAWPAIFLVDANGIIRHENLRGDDIDHAAEALVIEAEEAAK